MSRHPRDLLLRAAVRRLMKNVLAHRVYGGPRTPVATIYPWIAARTQETPENMNILLFPRHAKNQNAPTDCVEPLQTILRPSCHADPRILPKLEEKSEGAKVHLREGWREGLLQS